MKPTPKIIAFDAVGWPDDSSAGSASAEAFDTGGDRVADFREGFGNGAGYASSSGDGFGCGHGANCGDAFDEGDGSGHGAGNGEGSGMGVDRRTRQRRQAKRQAEPQRERRNNWPSAAVHNGYARQEQNADAY